LIDGEDTYNEQQVQQNILIKAPPGGEINIFLFSLQNRNILIYFVGDFLTFLISLQTLLRNAQ